MKHGTNWRFCYGIAAVFILSLLLMAATPQGRAIYHTTALVSQVVPSVPTVSLFQPDVDQTSVTIDTPNGPRDADLYRPEGDGPFAAVVLFLGVAPAGPDDVRVIRLAQGLARAGMVTLIYWSPTMIHKEIEFADVPNLVAAFEYLRSQPFVDEERVGFAGFCVGASFALMAGAQPEVRDKVAFINAFGPYFRLETLAVSVSSRTRHSDEGVIPWEPDSLTQEVTEKELLDPLPEEQQTLVRSALDEGTPPEPGTLEPDAMTVYQVLAGGTREGVEAAVEALPRSMKERMANLSPANYIDGLNTRVFIMHDREDNLIPSGQSRRLTEALREQAVDVRYTEFSFFQHVDPTRPVGIGEQVPELRKLFRHLYAIVRLAR